MVRADFLKTFSEKYSFVNILLNYTYPNGIYCTIGLL